MLALRTMRVAVLREQAEHRAHEAMGWRPFDYCPLCPHPTQKEFGRAHSLVYSVWRKFWDRFR